MTGKEKALAAIYQAARDTYPENILYVMPLDLSRKLKSFMLIREDLYFILDVAENLLSLKESAEPDAAIQLALWQSMLITYGKCFTENKAGFSKLEKSLFEKYQTKYQLLHENMMGLRHSYIAHRDDTEHEQAMVFIKVSNSGFMLAKDTEDIIIARKVASPKISDLKQIKELLTLLIEEASVKIQKHGDKAHNAFLNRYTPEQAKCFLVNDRKPV